MDILPDELCEMIAVQHPWAFMVVSQRFHALIAPKLGAILAARRRFLHIGGEKWTRAYNDIMDCSLEVESTKFAIVDLDPVYRTTIVPDGCDKPNGVKYVTRYSGSAAIVTTVVNALFVMNVKNNIHGSGECRVKVHKTDPRTGLCVTVHGVGYHTMIARVILQVCNCSVVARIGGERVHFSYADGMYGLFDQVPPRLKQLLRRVTIPGIMKWATDPDATLHQYSL